MNAAAKRKYLETLMSYPADLIMRSLANPSSGMRTVHIALHRIALRRKCGREHS